MYAECGLLVYPDPNYVLIEMDLGTSISSTNTGFDRGEQ